jgi:hypothetical protein
MSFHLYLVGAHGQNVFTTKCNSAGMFGVSIIGALSWSTRSDPGKHHLQANYVLVSAAQELFCLKNWKI